MSSACSYPAYPAWPPWQLGTLFLESSQLNLTTVPAEQPCLALRKENQVLKTLARAPEISASFWKQHDKNQDFAPTISALSPFQLFLPNSILRCISAWDCVVSACLPDILCFHRHTAAQLLPQRGKSLLATAAVTNGLAGWSNPWLTSTGFPGDAGGRGRTLSSAEISQHRKESKSCCNVWVAKDESFPSLDHAFFPWNQITD